MKQQTVLRQLGLRDYQSVWRDMQQFTAERTEATPDEIWITEHPPVFTLGLNGKQEHVLQASDIPLIQTDRGGQVTYHAPGQLVVYFLVDLRRLAIGPRQAVTLLENAMIIVLAQYGVRAEARADAPGVYVDGKKIGALGLRIKRGCCYHGLSLNNAMDLTPFSYINPCGYAGLEVTQLADFGVQIQTHELAVPVVHHLIKAIES
ncbi:lipoyl(octanoyl) transferase LipB [Methylomonas methanica]|uniref:Octanoyltransferase n=1 Tax=Methylomonas methanica (strain DSM 25384 / MC09) TaxID=857087 RepID=F9ZZZ0_METMM|nr:lipoyl(octanoyl) transferase LipB [Methylomonas methanica]AEF99958.1 Octanoyltransferase [Methylomonas methanica MC09]